MVDTIREEPSGLRGRGDAGCDPTGGPGSEKPWLKHYETRDYRRVWQGKALEDLAQKHIIRSWLPEGGRCLELGGGFGRITAVLEPMFGEVVSLEYSAKNVGMAKSVLKKASVARGDIIAIPSRDSTFDCVVMVRVIQLLVDPRAVMNEILRVARDGATVIISMPNLPVNNLMWGLKRGLSRDSGTGPFVWPYGNRVISVPPADFLPSGFEIMSRRGTGIFDNPLGSLMEPIRGLYLADVATSWLWFAKEDIFLKLKISKRQSD